jgi:outer membrane protease
MERGGKFDFLAKWVRADKEDGKYMKDVIWNEGFNNSLATG